MLSHFVTAPLSFYIFSISSFLTKNEEISDKLLPSHKNHSRGIASNAPV